MKHKKMWAAILIGVCALFFCFGCSGAAPNGGGGAGGKDSANGAYDDTADDVFNDDLRFVVKRKYNAGAVEKENQDQWLGIGETAWLRAMDTEEYTFLHWELNGEIISTKREYQLRVTMPKEKKQVYYAVFMPNDENKVLVNVLSQKGETMLKGDTDVEVSGGGYYAIGDMVTLRNEGNFGIVRTFTYDNNKADGPVLNITAEKHINVTATVERMVSLTLVENPNCTLNVENADNFFVEDEKYRVSAEITNENYVPDCWQIIDAITGEVYHERTWEENPIFEDVATLHDIYSRKEICLTLICTNENLVDTLPVEIISSTGDKVRVEVQKPSKMIAGRGFPLWVTPDANTYIQDIYETASEADDFPYKSEISFTSVQDIYSKGGVVFVPDPTEAFGAECKLVIKAIPREKAAVVHILSDDEFILEECEATGKKPSGYYAPSIADRTMVVEKNKETLHQLLHLENLNAIYEVGYEFAGVEDENGNKIADDLTFSFTVEEDTTYYIKWKKKE